MFAAAAEQALSEVPAVADVQDGPSGRTAWGTRLADRIDAMLAGAEPDDGPTHVRDDDAASDRAETAARPRLEIIDETAVPEPAAELVTMRRQPPPPPRVRRAKSTLEVDGDDVEATIEVAPTVRGGGGIVGPPPATRPAPSRPVTEATDDDPGDDDVTAVPRPASSMLPPRPRTHGKPRE